MATDKSTEDLHDETLEDSFPASDPPASSGITGAEPPEEPLAKPEDADIPTGTPTSDRHGAETVHYPEDKPPSK